MFIRLASSKQTERVPSSVKVSASFDVAVVIDTTVGSTSFISISFSSTMIEIRRRRLSEICNETKRKDRVLLTDLQKEERKSEDKHY